MDTKHGHVPLAGFCMDMLSDQGHAGLGDIEPVDLSALIGLVEGKNHCRQGKHHEGHLRSSA